MSTRLRRKKPKPLEPAESEVYVDGDLFDAAEGQEWAQESPYSGRRRFGGDSVCDSDDEVPASPLTSVGSRSSRKWDANGELILYHLLTEDAVFSREKWQEVYGKMVQKHGYSFTVHAVQSRFHENRKRIEGFATDGDAPAATATKQTRGPRRQKAERVRLDKIAKLNQVGREDSEQVEEEGPHKRYKFSDYTDSGSFPNEEPKPEPKAETDEGSLRGGDDSDEEMDDVAAAPVKSTWDSDAVIAMLLVIVGDTRPFWKEVEAEMGQYGYNFSFEGIR